MAKSMMLYLSDEANEALKNFAVDNDGISLTDAAVRLVEEQLKAKKYLTKDGDVVDKKTAIVK